MYLIKSLCILLFMLIVSCSINKQRLIDTGDIYLKAEVNEIDYDKYPDLPIGSDPYSPPTRIVFNVQNDSSAVKVNFYTINDSLISTIHSGFLKPGLYEVNPVDIFLNSGIYIWRITVNDEIFEKKILYLSEWTF